MNLNKNHWANQQERGTYWALKITKLLVCYCPLFILRIITMIVALYYYCSSKVARKNIQKYQFYLKNQFADLQPQLSSYLSVFKQFYEFSIAIVDKFAVWQGKINYEDLCIHDIDNLYKDIDLENKNGFGQIFLCSHLGNVEICRALVQKHQHLVLNILVHNAHAVKFNAALSQADSERIRLIQVIDLDVDIMMDLQMRVQCGEWVAIAADRVPVRGEKVLSAPFLGNMAQWAQGPWLLAGLLKVPVNVLFCVRQNGRYHLYLQRFAKQIVWNRANRINDIRVYIEDYAQILAQFCRQTPWQWFNFYDFWQDDDHE